MTDNDDFFADPKPAGPEPDQWGRPLLLPVDGSERRWYTRASSLANMLADFSHIEKWRMRYLARSLGQNPDLAALAGAECYTTGFDKGNEQENRMSGKRLDDVIERALDRGGITEKADYGTVVHAVTEPGNDGVAGWYQNVEADQASFAGKLSELAIRILATEVYVACDPLWSAGTFDHLMWVPGYGIVVTDKKTSSKVSGQDFKIQLAVYANGDVYDWETDERMSLEDYVASLGWDPALINRDVGLIFWIKDGKTSIHELDLVSGLEAAHRAAWVRDVHRRGSQQRKVDSEVERHLDEARIALSRAIAQAGTIAELTAIWESGPLNAVWTDHHTEAAISRRQEIEKTT